jgi:hypothetical protein
MWRENDDGSWTWWEPRRWYDNLWTDVFAVILIVIMTFTILCMG